MVLGCFQLSERKGLLKKNSKLKVVPKKFARHAQSSSRFNRFRQILIKIQDSSEDLKYFKAVDTEESRFGKCRLEFWI